MAYDAPARIAIVGAGPIGLEAALYARFLGYEVTLFERGRVAESVHHWGHALMDTPFGANASPLGLAALHGQDPQWQAPAADALLTGGEYAARYLEPLAASDLLCDCLHLQSEVTAIGRAGSHKGHDAGDPGRADSPFLLLSRSAEQGERTHEAEIVIDCSGTYPNPIRMGNGGIPAVGELQAARDIEYGLPDVLDRDRDRYAGREVLVVGHGREAAYAIVALAELARQVPGTHVDWVTTRDEPAGEQAPIARIADDPLPGRDRRARQANLPAADPGSMVRHRAGTWIERIEWSGERRRHRVHLAGRRPDVLEVERIIALQGYRPDLRIHSELHMQHCPSSEGPLSWMESVRNRDPAGDVKPIDPAALVTGEPDFYVLGTKSFGRDPRFLISDGLEQIRSLFTLIGDRADLNLYATVLPETDQAGRRP